MMMTPPCRSRVRGGEVVPVRVVAGEQRKKNTASRIHRYSSPLLLGEGKGEVAIEEQATDEVPLLTERVGQNMVLGKILVVSCLENVRSTTPHPPS